MSSSQLESEEVTFSTSAKPDPIQASEVDEQSNMSPAEVNSLVLSVVKAAREARSSSPSMSKAHLDSTSSPMRTPISSLALLNGYATEAGSKFPSRDNADELDLVLATSSDDTQEVDELIINMDGFGDGANTGGDSSCDMEHDSIEDQHDMDAGDIWDEIDGNMEGMDMAIDDLDDDFNHYSPTANQEDLPLIQQEKNVDVVIKGEKAEQPSNDDDLIHSVQDLDLAQSSGSEESNEFRTAQLSVNSEGHESGDAKVEANVDMEVKELNKKKETTTVDVKKLYEVEAEANRSATNNGSGTTPLKFIAVNDMHLDPNVEMANTISSLTEANNTITLPVANPVIASLEETALNDSKVANKAKEVELLTKSDLGELHTKTEVAADVLNSQGKVASNAVTNLVSTENVSSRHSSARVKKDSSVEVEAEWCKFDDNEVKEGVIEQKQVEEISPSTATKVCRGHWWIQNTESLSPKRLSEEKKNLVTLSPTSEPSPSAVVDTNACDSCMNEVENGDSVEQAPVPSNRDSQEKIVIPQSPISEPPTNTAVDLNAVYPSLIEERKDGAAEQTAVSRPALVESVTAKSTQAEATVVDSLQEPSYQNPATKVVTPAEHPETKVVTEKKLPTVGRPLSQTSKCVQSPAPRMQNQARSMLSTTASTSTLRPIEFRNPYPLPPPQEAPRPPDVIIKENSTPVEPRVSRMTKPKPQLEDLLLAAKDPSIARRSNACGALKVLASKKNNQTMLARTIGLLDSLVFAARECPLNVDAEAAVNARTRAVLSLLHLSEPKDNKRIIFEHPGLPDCLVKVIKEDVGEARVHACRTFALLVKCADNRDGMAKVTDLVQVLSQAARGVCDENGCLVNKDANVAPLQIDEEVNEDFHAESDDEDDKEVEDEDTSHDSMSVPVDRSNSTRGSRSYSQDGSDSQDDDDSGSGTGSASYKAPPRIASKNDLQTTASNHSNNVNKAAKASSQHNAAVIKPAMANSLSKMDKKKFNEFLWAARLNACATLLHLSKRCAVSAILCQNAQCIDNLVEVCKDAENQIHSKCLEVICHLTRFPSNNSMLSRNADLVDALIRCGKSKIVDTRMWSIRAFQNLTADASSKTILATVPLLQLLSVSAMRKEYNEQVAAVGALLNLSTEPGAIVPLTNTKNVVATLVHLAHSPSSSTDVCRMACDALATIGLWLQTLAGAGTVPADIPAVPLPSHVASGWMRWE